VRSKALPTVSALDEAALSSSMRLARDVGNVTPESIETQRFTNICEI